MTTVILIIQYPIWRNVHLIVEAFTYNQDINTFKINKTNANKNFTL